MAEMTCMVCGKSWDPKATGLEFRWNQDGTWYTFNDGGCRNKFIGNPKKYLAQASA